MRDLIVSTCKRCGKEFGDLSMAVGAHKTNFCSPCFIEVYDNMAEDSEVKIAINKEIKRLSEIAEKQSQGIMKYDAN